MKTSLKRLIIFFSFLFVLAATITFFIRQNHHPEVVDDQQQEVIEAPELVDDSQEEIIEEQNPDVIGEEEINELLPITVKVADHDKKPENFAYRLWFDFMNQLKEDGEIEAAFYNRFHFIEGDEDEFVVAVIFQVKPIEKTPFTSWGEVQEDGIVDGLVWHMKIKREEDRKYTLDNIEQSTDQFIGLPPIEDIETYYKEAGIQQPNENYRYEINNERLRVTYNNGEDWITVPVSIDRLFGGEYNGSKQNLIKDSYIISPERTAFVLADDRGLHLLLSTDQGKSWDEVLISDQFIRIRMRSLGFTSEQDGYLIVTNDRTMSSEGNHVLKTNDNGQSWDLVGTVKDTYRLVTDAGFVNNDLGFISFGSANYQDQPPRPALYRTVDGGKNWAEIIVPIPDEYEGIFIMAETPTFYDGQGTLIVNQGPEGDYLGGKVLAKFTSEDEGETWDFASLIDPNNVLGTK